MTERVERLIAAAKRLSEAVHSVADCCQPVDSDVAVDLRCEMYHRNDEFDAALRELEREG